MVNTDYKVKPRFMQIKLNRRIKESGDQTFSIRSGEYGPKTKISIPYFLNFLSNNSSISALS